jgi:CheY-like chemotaxis protein
MVFSPAASAHVPVALALVADDDPAIREILREILEHHGYEVIEAGTVRQAIVLFTERSPDLLMTDWDFKDGYYGKDLIEALDVPIRERRLRVVAHHGNDHADADPFCRARGIPSVHKPARIAEIMGSIQAVMAS